MSEVSIHFFDSFPFVYQQDGKETCGFFLSSNVIAPIDQEIIFNLVVGDGEVWQLQGRVLDFHYTAESGRFISGIWVACWRDQELLDELDELPTSSIYRGPPPGMKEQLLH